MKIYEIELSISWLGGIATVIANSEEEALQLCKEYFESIEPPYEGYKKDKFNYRKITEKPLEKGVVQFWDGDY